MKRINLLVEGQTEEAFVNELLIPHFSYRNIFFNPIIVSTSKGYKGGVVSYAKIKPQIEKLCKEDSDAIVSTLFDLYALPNDFPGKMDSNYLLQQSGHAKACFLEQRLEQDINEPNFIANILVHEYEALLFTDIEAFKAWTDDDGVLKPLQQIRMQYLPEDINDQPTTAPSKRILKVWKQYEKTVHGPLIACDIGIDSIRQSCPHFHNWLTKLENIS